jgi:hypothetical protein
VNPNSLVEAAAAGLMRMHYFYHLENATGFVIKYLNNKPKLGGTLNNDQTQAVRALHKLVRDRLKITYGAIDGNFDEKMADNFGRRVDEVGTADDLRNRAVLQWYTDVAARKVFKLSFRSGLAHRWAFAAGGTKVDGSLYRYDTDTHEDRHVLEGGGGFFVMDGGGKIFTDAHEPDAMSLKHSSFLAGAPTACAGTIRIEQGQVVWMSGKSGHYKPTVMQMVNLLERLRTYAVDLKKVTVYRENNVMPPKARGQAPMFNFEACPAVDLLNARKWPTGPEVHKNKMRVD